MDGMDGLDGMDHTPTQHCHGPGVAGPWRSIARLRPLSQHHDVRAPSGPHRPATTIEYGGSITVPLASPIGSADARSAFA